MAPNRTGYTLEVRNEDDPSAQTYWIVTREDGVGIGAYPDDAAIDKAIAADRELVASAKAAREAAASAESQTIASTDVQGVSEVAAPRLND